MTRDASWFDISSVDCDAFLEELNALRREVDEGLGQADIDHLKKIEWWGRAFTAIGAATAGLAPNPVSATCLALGRGARWVMMHHVGHRGYDHVPGVPARYTSKVFARGRRRFLDWADWLTPAAWVYEHNVLHHSHTAESKDPDLIERNTEVLRELPLPKPLRYAAIGFLSLVWRPAVYAPNAVRAWKGRGKNKEEGAGRYDIPTMAQAFFDADFWREGCLPYSALHFGLFPALYWPLGPWGIFSAWSNSVMAEVLTNIHTFAVVLPNHSGDDLYRYEGRAQTRAEAYVRQIISSANYDTGSDAIGFAHLWLNYQIEHHVWPDLPLLKYREVAPKVKALCERHGIPYVQEGLLARFRKMSDVVVGNTSMRRYAA